MSDKPDYRVTIRGLSPPVLDVEARSLDAAGIRELIRRLEVCGNLLDEFERESGDRRP
jgi:hypothetical protein